MIQKRICLHDEEWQYKISNIDKYKCLRGYKYMGYVMFENPLEMYKWCEETPLNMSGKEKEKRKECCKTKKSNEWDLNTTYHEAFRMFTTGSCELFVEELKEETSKNYAMFKRMPVNKLIQSVVGNTVNVPLYLNGVPNNMITSVKKNTGTSLVINKCLTFDGTRSGKYILEEAGKTVAIIKVLLDNNVKVKLNILDMTEFRDNLYNAMVTVKNFNEPINFNKMAFMLFHPAVLRRCLFRIIDIHPWFEMCRYYGECFDTQTQLIINEHFFKDSLYITPSISRNTTMKQYFDMCNKITGLTK